MKSELVNHKDNSKKTLNVKDKQIEQLVDGFQKQMQLIDVLRRQKVYIDPNDQAENAVLLFWVDLSVFPSA